MKITKRTALITFKLLVTGASVYWLITLADFRLAWQSITAVPFLVVFLAIDVMLVAFLAGSLRWWLLLRHTAGPVQYARVLPGYYLGVFFNNILPTTMGGDVVRTVHLSLRGINSKALIGSAVIDRFVGLYIILTLGFVNISMSSEIVLERGDRLLLVGVGAMGAAGIWIFFNARFLDLIRHWANRYQYTRIRKFLLETVQLCHSYKSARGTLLVAVALTILLQSAVITSYYILGKAIGITLSLFTYFGIIPLVFLLGAVPISLGGIGVREGALVGLLVAIGVDIQPAIALSLLYLFVLLASSLPGSLVMLFSRARKITRYE